MPSTPLQLLNILRSDHPKLTFQQGDDFHWDHTKQTIFYPSSSKDPSWSAQLLHELSHATLGHRSYDRDIELIALERDAWKYARSTLAPFYNTAIDQAIVEAAMDSYRDWLHARSTCPSCSAIGHEVQKHTYRCVACREEWQVNEARMCHLRRYRIQK